ncbi:uncharacterized protein LOC114535301 [Dendronephthya gigantea]|uniref:uncharacterized protein LOC114535301 n=1 Tax=Dendronephthya gigantea TaxID=151771 RepID=UPI00106A1B66|nr:uncharacterized protein LOC114535301 [Dendronephthya gigantea]
MRSGMNGTDGKTGSNNNSPFMVSKPSEELGSNMLKETDEIYERMGAYGVSKPFEEPASNMITQADEANERTWSRSENEYDDHDIKPIELPKPSEKSGSMMVARTVRSNEKIRSHEEFGKNVKPIEVLKPLEKSDVMNVTATGESNERIRSRNKSVKAISQKIKKPSKEFGPIAVKKTIPPKKARESTDSKEKRKRLNSAVTQELQKRKLRNKIRQYQEEKLKLQAELSEVKTKKEKLETDKYNLFTQTQMQVEKLHEWEEVSIDIEETSEEVEETAYKIMQVCTIIIHLR